jgi:hypothetical protein
MAERELESGAEELPIPEMPRVMPRAHFAQDLAQELRCAAAREAVHRPEAHIDGMVMSLRSLAQLLCRTLVPVCASASFRRALGVRLQEEAAALSEDQQRQWRWLMLGGVLGSILSVLGLVAALGLRRRNGQGRVKKTIGLA